MCGIFGFLLNENLSDQDIEQGKKHTQQLSQWHSKHSRSSSSHESLEEEEEEKEKEKEKKKRTRAAVADQDEFKRWHFPGVSGRGHDDLTSSVSPILLNARA